MRTILAFLVCLMASCSQPSGNWLLGEWEFDADYTTKKQAEKPQESDLIGATKAMVKEQLNEKMTGARLKVTEQEFVMTTKDGNGRSFTYTVEPGSDANAKVLKMSDGEVNTFHREDDRIWMNSTGNVNEPFYFKRKK
jgi:hypothetical protein